MHVRHVAQAQDRDYSPRMANGLSEVSARCYLIAVKTGELLGETLPKLAHLAIIPYGVRVLSGTGIKNHIVREPPPIRCWCALASASADAMLCLREHKRALPGQPSLKSNYIRQMPFLVKYLTVQENCDHTT